MPRSLFLTIAWAAGLLTPILPVAAQQRNAAPRLMIQQPPAPPIIGIGRMQRNGLITNEGRTTGWIQTETRRIDNDSHKAYVLLAPGGRGYNGRRNPFRANDVPGVPGSKDAPPEMPSAGLLVVLPPADGDGTLAAQFWAEVMRSVLKGRYYVAVAVAPKWADAQAAPWTTETTLKQTKGALFTTESFVKDIVNDVNTVYNIDPQRVFLHGAAESGLAAYACSLMPQTPFKGFYIHDAPFRSGQLPPLATSRGRRYFLQQSQDDKTGPLWMAEAARKLLMDKGATVKVAPYHGTGAYNFADNNRWEHLSEAMTWLESGSQPIAKMK